MLFELVVKERHAVEGMTKMASRMVDVRPLKRELLAVLVEGERRMWARPRGSRWAPLAESTIERKRRQGMPPQILVATGRLRDSLINEDAAGAIREAGPDYVRFGTTVVEAKFQVKGTANPSQSSQRTHRHVRSGRDASQLHTPPRKILALGAREKREMKTAIARYIAGE